MSREPDMCATCRFWLETSDGGPFAHYGTCRRFPPPQPPTTSTDWCGEFQRTPEEEPS